MARNDESSPDHIANREAIIASLRSELVGPESGNVELDCLSPIIFSSFEESARPWCQKGSGEEILRRDSPCKRYGVGVLYTAEVTDETADGINVVNELGEGIQESGDEEAISDPGIKRLEKIKARVRKGRKEEGDSEDFEILSTNSYRPSAFGISFLAEIPPGGKLVVKATGGRYHKLPVRIAGKDSIWWKRSPVVIKAEYNRDSLYIPLNGKSLQTSIAHENAEGLDLHIEVFSRVHSNGARLFTVCLINRAAVNSLADDLCLFQSHFVVHVISSEGKPHILPYPEANFEKSDHEELSLALLYRKRKIFSVGHGCAAGWKISAQEIIATEVSADCLPVYETPSITPRIWRDNGSEIKIPMANLAGLVEGDDGFKSLEEVVFLYERWINARSIEAQPLGGELLSTANRHLKECKAAAERMRAGLRYLKTTPVALEAFRLANHAILLQQVRASSVPREFKYDAQAHILGFSSQFSMPDPLKETDRGKWRPFQIAFILMALISTGENDTPEREKVELIWFPTGGGKTEAYLGLTAFSIFYRRLKDPKDTGTNVLMRYTLRLLTAQQFQRASGLICSMEHLRKKRSDLGAVEFSIGIWLGGGTTPNSCKDAIAMLRELRKRGHEAENGFLVDRCPWCRAQIGPHEIRGLTGKVLGYDQRGSTVVVHCPDRLCEFYNSLPIYVIDEDVYEKRPSLVIGTVDKFAVLSWRANARSLFGIGKDGLRFASPPGLIIQDELHLISGPLGSMVGLFEVVVEDLCTDHRSGKPRRPKIVCSTATIRRYAQQVLDLFGRTDVALFPPPGIDVEDSFFASYALVNGDPKTLMRGRVYVGVHAPGLGSLQTAQVRTFAALLQAPAILSRREKDPWWTLMLFFNSLRELGTSLSLFQSDIPNRLKMVWNRMCVSLSYRRHIDNPLELTGRLRSDEVPRAIKELEKTTDGTSKEQIDYCLSSSIIEVGVDIERLSLLCVVGQPKTTSQYIQVTGRVGRKWWERPGLVVTIYGASKPRDRSHFEQFRSYHEQLYAQVEPTSVTPFSLPALERALHAVMAAYVRQNCNEIIAENPFPFPEELIGRLRELMLARVRRINTSVPAQEQESHFQRIFDKRCAEWKSWGKHNWDKKSGEDAPLLFRAGSYIKPADKLRSWGTPTSMRNVDASCEVEITQLYATDLQEDHG